MSNSIYRAADENIESQTIGPLVTNIGPLVERIKSPTEKKYRLSAKLVLGVSISLCFAVLLAFIAYIVYVSIKTL